MDKHNPTNHNDIINSFAFDNTYLRLPKKLFTATAPTPVKEPSMVVFNAVLARELGLNADMLDSPRGAAILGGNTGVNSAGNGVENGAANGAENGVTTIAQAYAGHQFGHFTMLGDGRAILLGEQITPKGDRFDIQLKGAGPTAYSRRGDGRAALGPMLREYLISESMHGLGIPSTRSLAVVATGERIVRETNLPGAVLTRVAKSHLRVGTFQFAAAALEIEEFKALADYAINRHYPLCHEADNPYLSFFESVIEAQAALIARWQAVGFVHGVMNTDNMAISGETIDYGPCAFVDTYSPGALFSSIDQNGRYAYNNQPSIGGWNLARLGEALLPLIAKSINDSRVIPHDSRRSEIADDSSRTETADDISRSESADLIDKDSDKVALDLVNKALGRYTAAFESHYRRLFCSKIGIADPQPGDIALVTELLKLMEAHQLDFTYTFYALTVFGSQPDLTYLESLTEWLVKWQTRLAIEQHEQGPYQVMKTVNPAAIPYNHLVEAALVEASTYGNFEPYKGILALLQEPYAYTDEQRQLAAPPPKSVLGKPYRTFCGT